MNRYGTLPRGGPTKAAASTLCQKCLKRDIHYSYECKAVAQERPYVSRPSRTQQLLNPKLLPKLASDVPQDLLRKKGVANEQLAKIEQERGRRRERPEDATEPTKKLNSLRSESSNSSVSVATISTNASRSPRTGQKAQPQPNDRLSSSRTYMETTERKRRRSVSSDDSLPSGVEPNSVGSTMASTRSTRRKIGEHSPLTRGRRRSRTGSRSRHTSYSSSNRSLDADDTRGPYRASPASRPRRRDNTDPYIKQQNYRDGSSSPHRRSHQKRAKSRELEESSRKATDSNSMRRPRDRSFSSDSLGRRHYPDIDERYGTSVKVTERFAGRVAEDRKPFRAPPRDRSLSPFSKRLALTQAMNAGR